MRVEVLVIEDNESDFRLAEAAICRAFLDVKIVWATTLEEAASLADTSDAIVLDLSLPNVSGVAGVERLPADYPDVPLIVLTGRGADDPIAQAPHLERGPDACRAASSGNRIRSAADPA